MLIRAGNRRNSVLKILLLKKEVCVSALYLCLRIVCLLSFSAVKIVLVD